MYPLKSIHIECTNRCNYNCKHCYSGSESSRHSEIPYTQLESLLSEAAACGVDEISISGGEPLLYPKLNEAICLAKESGMDVMVSTNASLLSKDRIDVFKSLEVDLVTVSLHGANEKSHDFLTGVKGSFWNAMTAIDNLSNLKCTFAIATTVSSLNINEIRNITRIVLSYQPQMWYVFRFIPLGRGRENEELLALSPLEHQRAMSMISAELGRYPVNVRYVSEYPYVDLSEGKAALQCEAGKSWCVIDATGSVYPCTGLRGKQMLCGNVSEESLSKIWETSQKLRNLRSILENPLNIGEPCSICAHIQTCRGGCRAAAVAKAGGRMDSSDETCWRSL